MKLLKDIGKAVWYMAKAGLLYGALLGGLFALSFVLLGIVISITTFAQTDNGMSVRIVLVGAVLGGGVGVVVGAIDGPVLALLIRVQFPQTRHINPRGFTQGVNALLTGIGAYIAFILLFPHSDPSALCFLVIVGCIAGGAFWYATGKFADKINQS